MGTVLKKITYEYPVLKKGTLYPVYPRYSDSLFLELKAT